ncbi:MAG: MFS transporter [Clostridia bacterium]|nr:MFS transporter [Clostridia bacterium]
MKQKLLTKNKICYGVGNLGYGTISQTMSNFIMFFGTSVLGVPGTLVGIAVAISAFWDGLSDPIIGYISDRHKSKTFGRRLGFMLVATFGMAVFNLLLWSIPNSLSVGFKFVWLIVCLLSIETFNTFFATPYVALGIDIAPDYNDQSSIQGYKTVFFIIGMILPTVFMIIFMPSKDGVGQLVQSGYINMSYVTSILCVICGAICIIGTLKRAKSMPDFDTKQKEDNAFFKIFYNFFKTLGNKNFSPIICGYSIALISAAFLMSVGMHLFTYSFHFTSTQISLTLGTLFIGAIISQPFWIFLSKRIDKKPALNVALSILLVGIFLVGVIFGFRTLMPAKLCFYLILPSILFCGFGTGALYSLPISMFADVVTLEKLKSNQNKTATYSGYMTFAYNVANSVSLFVIGVLLDLIKFNPSEPVQAIKVQNALGIIVLVGCIVSIGLSMFIFNKYKLTRAEILKEQMRAKKANN